MKLFDFLLNKYGYNEPIFSNEICFEGYSKPWVYKALNELCASNQIIRFEKGVYYIPRETALGLSIMNPRKVIEKKYIQSKEDVYGYYSGQFFLNQIGISNQMPNIIELYSNREATKVRDIIIGKQKVRLRKSRVEITKENASILKFLELMNDVDVEALDEDKRNLIDMYIKENNINRKGIAKYAPAFPDRVMRAMIESEAIYNVTQ